MKRVINIAVYLWISGWTLLIVRSVFGGLTNARATFGIGILQLHGRTTLLATTPLAVAGVLGLLLAWKNRRLGHVLIAAFAFTWAFCLGLDQFSDFQPPLAAVGSIFLLCGISSIGRALSSGVSQRAKGATA